MLTPNATARFANSSSSLCTRCVRSSCHDVTPKATSNPTSRMPSQICKRQRMECVNMVIQ